MSQRFLLRAEAVNLASFVYDTSRLPTVRGGGLLLLRAPRKIEEWLRGDPRAAAVEPLRSGASACVFAFAAEPKEAAAVRGELERKLGADEELKHASFVVDVLADTGEFVKDVERLLALNRFRQLRSPSVVFPAEPGQGACAIDGIRPGTSSAYLPGEKSPRNISDSVRARTDYGRGQKQAFYREEANQDLDDENPESQLWEEMRFARDFKDLADGPPAGMERLDGKMAVLYLDGNRFGATQRAHCRSEQDSQEFDRLLQGRKRAMLAGVLTAIRQNPEGWTARPDRGTRLFRLETLLWGGDELLFVAPAWQGWWLLGEVFAGLAGLELGEPLSFAAGLVFCHANAPIRRMKNLAEMLAEEAKNRSRKENLAAYQVMESFDVVPGDFAGFRNRRSADGDRAGMVLDAARLKDLAAAIRELKPQVSRKRLYKLTEALLSGSARAADLQRELAAASSPGAWEKLERAAGSSAAAALHLAELWDYLPEESAKKEAAAAEVAHAL